MTSLCFFNDQLVGAQSPVNHRGLHRGCFNNDRDRSNEVLMHTLTELQMMTVDRLSGYFGEWTIYRAKQ